MVEWWETQPDDSPGFAEWLRSFFRFDAADPGEVDADNRRWFRDYFADTGPVSSEIVGRGFRTRQAEVVTEAVAAVRSDLERATSEHVNIVVELDEWGGVRVAVDGCYSGSPVSHIERAEVLVEIADDVQELWYGPVINGRFTCWPECRTHNVGLHPEVRDAHAVWWCRLGQHVIAAIGQLDPVG